jgi:hypothetical protein
MEIWFFIRDLNILVSVPCVFLSKIAFDMFVELKYKEGRKEYPLIVLKIASENAGDGNDGMDFSIFWGGLSLLHFLASAILGDGQGGAIMA